MFVSRGRKEDIWFVDASYVAAILSLGMKNVYMIRSDTLGNRGVLLSLLVVLSSLYITFVYKIFV